MSRSRLNETMEFPPIQKERAWSMSEMEEDPYIEDEWGDEWEDELNPGAEPDMVPAEYIADIVAEEGVEATHGVIEFSDGGSLDFPAKDVQGNSYEFSGSGRMSIQGDMADTKLEVGEHNLSVTDTLVRGSSIRSTGGSAVDVQDSTVMDGAIVVSSTVANSELRGHGMARECIITGSTVAHSGNLNFPITLHRVSMHNYAVNGANITVRDSGFVGGDNERGRLINDGMGQIVMSSSLVESQGGGRAPHLSCRGNGEMEIRGSSIATGTTISSEGSGLFTKVAVSNSSLSYVHIVATGGLQMRNSVFVPGTTAKSPVLMAIPEKLNVSINNALVTSPEHIQKWYDNGRDMGWVYRTAPEPGSRTTRATFVGLKGDVTVVDGYDLLLYTSGESGAGDTTQDSIARVCQSGMKDFIGEAEASELTMVKALRDRGAEARSMWGH